MNDATINGYLRSDGRKGVRNIVVVAYLVECAHHVAREIVYPLRSKGVHLLGFPGCYPNSYAHRMLRQLCTHPNVGAVLRILDGEATIDEVGDEIHRLIMRVASGAPTASEELGHQEFSLVYKSFAPLGPECLPSS